MRLLRRLLSPCPPMQINGADSTKIAVWVGGKHSNARSKPTFHKLVIANLPNNPPRWPEVEEVVRKILYAYKENAPALGAHGRVDRAHRLASLLRTDRIRLHQASSRYMDRRAQDHEHVGPYPLLNARSGERACDSRIVVNEGPYTHQASDSALQFARAALAKGHEIFRVFFYHDGVNNGTRSTIPPQDDRNLQQRWSELAADARTSTSSSASRRRSGAAFSTPTRPSGRARTATISRPASASRASAN